MESGDYGFRWVVYARDTLLAGFTTVRELGDQDHNVTMARRDAIQAGDVIGPRIMPQVRGWRRLAVWQRYKEGADVIKLDAGYEVRHERRHCL